MAQVIGPSDIVAMHDGWCVTSNGNGVRHLRPVVDGLIARRPADVLAAYHQSADGRWWGSRRDITAAAVPARSEEAIVEALAAILGLPAPASLVAS